MSLMSGLYLGQNVAVTGVWMEAMEAEEKGSCAAHSHIVVCQDKPCSEPEGQAGVGFHCGRNYVLWE